jgi:hypothetical protein
MLGKLFLNANSSHEKTNNYKNTKIYMLHKMDWKTVRLRLTLQTDRFARYYKKRLPTGSKKHSCGNFLD